MKRVRRAIYDTLRKSEGFFKTDMVYLAKSGFWLNLNFIFVSVFSLVLSIAFANLLPKEQFGIYQYILSISAILAAFTFTGMNTAITQAVARGYEGALKKSIKPQLIWNLIPAGAAIIWSIYYFFHGNTLLGIGMIFVSISLPILNTFNSYGAYLNGKKEFKKLTFYTISNGAIYYVLMLLSLAYLPSALILLFINLVVNALVTAYIFYRVVKTYHPSTEVDTSISKYAYHLSFMGIIGTISGQVDNVLVFHFLGAAELAVYSIATILPERLAGVFKFVISSAMPKFAEKDINEIRESLPRKLLFLMLAVGGVILFYIIVSPLVFKLLYPKYDNAVFVSQIYSLTILSLIGGLAATAFYAQKKVRELYILNTIVPIFQVGLQFVAVVFWGLLGLVIAKVISVVLMSLATIALLYSVRSTNT